MTEVSLEQLLDRARQNDDRAASELVHRIWKRYEGAVRHMFSKDPSEDWEDLRQIFQLAVFEHIPKLDHRGSPVYHLGVRGWWAIGAHIQRKKKMQNLSLNFATEEGGEMIEHLSDQGPHFADVVVNRIGAEQQMEVIESVRQIPTIAGRTIEILLTGELGDPDEKGFNKRLAAALGVSPQRASQAMRALRKAMNQKESELTLA